VDGTVYNGEWLNDRRDGFGIFRWLDGSQYNGEWTDDKITGNGRKYFTDGRLYNGLFVDGKMDGKGTMTYPDGYECTCIWVDDKRNGRCRFKCPTGEIRKVNMTDDVFADDNMEIKWPNGSIYKGKHKNIMMDGKGQIVYKNGIIIDGEWKDDKKNGIFEIRRPQLVDPLRGWYGTRGYTYEFVEYKDDQKHGKSRIIDRDGHEEISFWNNGIRVSSADLIQPPSSSLEEPLLEPSSLAVDLHQVSSLGADVAQSSSVQIDREQLSYLPVDWSNEFIPALLPDGVRNDIFLLDEDDIDINVYMGHLGI
jgi:hypothetical protein